MFKILQFSMGREVDKKEYFYVQVKPSFSTL
jgi:hypothetical protein